MRDNNNIIGEDNIVEFENPIPNAEEVYNDFHFNYKGDNNSILEAMKEFARLHVNAALKAASTSSDDIVTRQCVEDILNAYPKSNIK